MPASVGLQVEPRQVEIAPGEVARLRARILNDTGIVDQFTVVVVGVDERLAPAPQQLSLLPGKEGVAEIVLAVPREQPPPAGAQVIGVKATSVADPSVASVEEVALTIGALPAASLGVEPPVARGGTSASFVVGVANRGNVPLQVTLRGEDNDRAVRFQFKPATLDVPLGGRVRSDLQVSASPPLVGPAVRRVLTVSADGGPAPLGYSVAFVQRSRVTSGALRALVVAATMVVLGGVAVAASLLLNGGSSKSSPGVAATAVAGATTRAGGTAVRATGTTSSAGVTIRPATTAAAVTSSPVATTTATNPLATGTGPAASGTTATTPLPTSGSIAFARFPDGQSVDHSIVLQGNEFLSAGIRASAAPEPGSCTDPVAALIAPGSYKAKFYALSTAERSDVTMCNEVPVAVDFTQPVRQVTLVFAGERATYQLKVYDTRLVQIGRAQRSAVDDGSSFQIGYSSGSSNISRIVFGSTGHVTLVGEIRYQR